MLSRNQRSVKISYGMIVLNGEPFILPNLRSIYPYAHEIIVVEGASLKASSIASIDGHSKDNTIFLLNEFVNNEDDQNKVKIITAEDEGYPNGFWPGGKDELSRAYSKRATGNYLWQIDVDEFYKPEDIQKIISILEYNDSITQVNFYWKNFWGDFSYLVDGIFLKKHIQDMGGGVPRVFKWGEGYKYISHRPPNVFNSKNENLKEIKLLDGKRLADQGIYCYHYSSIFTDQVDSKMTYYQSQDWDHLGNFDDWFNKNFHVIRQPFRIHHVQSNISWLKRFSGLHPPIVDELINKSSISPQNYLTRDNSDVEELLQNYRYKLGVIVSENLSSVLVFLLAYGRLSRIEQFIERLLEIIFSPSIKNSSNE